MFAVAATFFSGCIDVNISPIEPQGPTTVNLQLRNADLVATRAITDDNQYHEDLINSVQCFFTVTDTDAVVYATDLLPINAQQTKTLTVKYSYVSQANGAADGSDIVIEEIKNIPLTYRDANNVWEPGVHYTYNITIGTQEILIEPTVEVWDTVTAPDVVLQ